MSDIDRSPTGDSANRADTLHLDGRALRILAHPLRSRLLTALRIDGPSTATALAGALHTNSGATSYHLRKLAEVGLVEETDQGQGKERYWRAATNAHAWEPRDLEGDADSRAASAWLQLHYLDDFTARYRSWLAAQDSWPLEWREVLGARDQMLSLSPSALAALSAEIQGVLDRYRLTPGHPDQPDQADVRSIHVFVHAFPRSPEQS